MFRGTKRDSGLFEQPPTLFCRMIISSGWVLYRNLSLLEDLHKGICQKEKNCKTYEFFPARGREDYVLSHLQVVKNFYLTKQMTKCNGVSVHTRADRYIFKTALEKQTK